MKELIISKELISEVLNIKVEDIVSFKMFGYDLMYYEKALFRLDCQGRVSKNRDSICKSINIYEFAYKWCKEWAENKGYIIFSKNKECLIYSIDEVYDVIECLNQYEDYFEANTEIESIVKACNWILENIK